MDFLCYLKTHSMLFLIIIFSLSMPEAVFPATDTSPVLADREKRSIIQIADGYVGPAGNRTLKQLRAEALKVAKRQAMEQANQFLRKKNIREVALEYEIIKIHPHGFVKILNQKDSGLEDNGRYHVRIEAEVVYILKDTKGGRVQQFSELMDKADILTVRIWTDKKQYREGEPVYVYVEGNRDFNARIVKVGAKGICQLLPNNYRQVSFFKKGKTYKIPDEGDRFNLQVSQPFGTESFVVYATQLPMSHINMKTIAGGLYQYRASMPSFERSVRSGLPIGEGQTVQFYEAAWDILTLPR